MKRLVICCDGTWNQPNTKTPTNVVLTARAVQPMVIVADANQRIHQLTFYDWGVGTGNLGEKLAGGAMGKGLNKNIMDAYRFIVHNYENGDELFFFGFSRGAYTARSTVGLIRNCGILKKSEAGRIPEAFRMYKSNAGPDSPSALAFRESHSHHAPSQGEGPTVKFLGVWDTVGALGVPLFAFKQLNDRKYRFHDTELSGIVEHAYHAVAIDERRSDFVPVLWSNPPKSGQTVEQSWFPGVHSDVGGGYRERGLANGTLHWLLAKAQSAGLSVDHMQLMYNIPNPLDKLHRSQKGFYHLKGWKRRKITAYNVSTPSNALDPSVRQRVQGNGYMPKPLAAFLEAHDLDWSTNG